MFGAALRQWCYLGFLAIGLMFFAAKVMSDAIEKIQVLGTVIGANKNSSYAIIIVDKGEAENFKKGQSIIPGYTLEKIYDDKITVKHGANSLNIKIGVPFSSEDFNVESALPPSYEQPPPVEVPMTPEIPPADLAPPEEQSNIPVEPEPPQP